MPDAAPLTPFALDVLLGRIANEWESRRRIFDLPSARFWKRSTDVDLTMDFLGRPAATPVGPAAGPHSQMAQNLVLGWLAGARFFELKTVQVLDDLDIARPCIDMQTIGFNIEWSQELKVAESLEEYVKAWMMIEILRQWEPIAEYVGNDPGPHVFDLSVGYDLAGIQTEKVAGFIDSMMDASSVIERLRAQIPEPFAAFRDYDFPSRIADTLTLSTFHGCPPPEIEAMVKHLMDRHGLDVVVKLNPTLLGFGRVVEVLQQDLAYEHVRLNRLSFVEDLDIERAVDLITELRRYAEAKQRRLGVKLTNTMVVNNDKGFLPDDPMYMSGPPLHVLATCLLDDLINTMPGVFKVHGHDGPVQVSFSAGVSKENISRTVGMGVAPATLCSDLLRPGGYGRLEPILRRLERDMAAAGAATLAEWHRHSWDLAKAAGFRGPAEAHMTEIVRGHRRAIYDVYAHEELPRSVDHDLEMWGCVACNFCVTVCPNDAFFRLPTPEGAEMSGRQQYMVFAELCNECGNCMVFCPENGDPAQVKPRLFLDDLRFADSDGQGFLLEQGPEGVAVIAHDGYESQVPLLLQLLNDQSEGIPIRAADLG
ncbi:MAG TPA: 4Fe-4S dicluster domain-containing protein [Acidimicrobiia bacterium]|jgi:putative selenate reductase|nr:4Fe-4S dicluster domain-containing protein [Acidimicrobiia bacterium]